jgi:hypothetical protein
MCFDPTPANKNKINNVVFFLLGSLNFYMSTMNWKCTHTTWTEKMAWPEVNPGKPFCTNFHLQHNCLITTNPWLPFLAPTLGRFSLILSTGLHLGSLPSTACFSTRTRSLSVTPPCDWLMLFSSQTFSRINTPTISSAYEAGRDSVPKRRHIKFRGRGITQKKEHNIQNMAKVWNQE